MPSRRAFLTVPLALAALPLAARAAERVPVVGPRLDEVLREIARARASVRTFAGPFTQTRRLGLMKVAVTSRGRVTFVAPTQLRWELSPPDEVVYWITRDGVAYKSRSGQGSLRAADARALAAGLDDLRAMLGGDLAPLRQRYDLAAFASGDDLEIEATARPAEGARGMKAIHFGVGKDRVRPTFARLLERNGDTSEVRFGELALNVPVDPALMHP